MTRTKNSIADNRFKDLIRDQHLSGESMADRFLNSNSSSSGTTQRVDGIKQVSTIMLQKMVAEFMENRETNAFSGYLPGVQDHGLIRVRQG